MVSRSHRLRSFAFGRVGSSGKVSIRAVRRWFGATEGDRVAGLRYLFHAALDSPPAACVRPLIGPLTPRYWTRRPEEWTREPVNP